MRKLVESTFVTLDGVVSTPEVWGSAYWNEEHDAYARDLLFAADALLLGRKTYENFAASWPSRTGNEYADRINKLPKHVASTTLRETTWNATVIDGDVAAAVAAVKQEPGETILKFGTGVLDHLLLGAGLIDELHLWVFPAILGSGERLLAGLEATHLTVADTTTFSTGITVLRLTAG